MQGREMPFYIAADGVRLSATSPRWRAEDGSPLSLSEGDGLLPAQVDQSKRSLWRYAAAIRVDAARGISLGEGWTPLIEQRWDDHPVHFKLEYISPTGSFKDRGTSVLMSYLRQVGVRSMLEDSSGNAGASMAAYAAAGGIACRILVPAGAPAEKIMQMEVMGADVVPVAGTRQDVADAALRDAERYFYASHNWHPFFLEGTKTLAFELWEQFGFEAPDAVIVPLGYGSNVLGLHIGFSELLKRGLIERLPRIFGTQAENCSSFSRPWKEGKAEYLPFEAVPTVADGIASLRPVRLKEVLSAMRDSGGGLVTVSESQIIEALKRLMGRGIFVEPTSAVAAAATSILAAEGRLSATGRTVVVFTGSGLKAAGVIGRLLGAKKT